MKLAVVAALALALALLSGRVYCAPRAPAATVVYYYIPGCAVCARTSQRLEKVAAAYPGRVDFRRIDCTSPEGVAAVARYGFRSHGLALLDAAGHPQLVESDHRVFPEHLAEALDRLLR